ncbi:MAG: thioredoxin domain-containing protein [Halobacteria archaeon]
MAEERPPGIPMMLEKPPPGQPAGLLGLPPAAPPDERASGEVPSRPSRPWGGTVAVRLPHLFAIAVALAFVSGFALHAAVFPGTSPAGGPAPAAPAGTLAAGRIQLSNGLGDAYTEGNTNAKVQLIEFSDYQCPFCRRHYTQTAPTLLADYVRSGKVLYAYRDFPLDNIHPGATPWAIAARCAGEQGKYKALHDKIFDEQSKQGQGTISYEDYAAVAKQWAQELGLDAGAFNACLDSRKYARQVQRDLQDGFAAGVSGTPSFFVGNPQKGYVRIEGARELALFKQTLDQELASA